MTRKNTEQIFWSRCFIPDDSNSCWLWTAYIDEWGYGVFRYNYKGWRAHRLSYRFHYGELPPGELVLHMCGVPNCINPRHLYLGNDKDNTRDSIEHGTFAWGEKSGHAKLKEVDIPKIRALKLSNRKTAKLFGVSHNIIGLIRRGKLWNQVL